MMKLRRRVAPGISDLNAGWTNSRKIVRPICVVFLSLLLEACTKPTAQDPITLTLIEEWTSKSFSEARQEELQQFTR